MLLYKFKSTLNLLHLLDIVVHERLYCPRYSDLNDPFEGQFRELLVDGGAVAVPPTPPRATNFGTPNVLHVVYRDLMDLPLVQAIRVCSLTNRYDDVRMWSLYGDSHRGVAVEIDFDNYDHMPVEVRYDDCLPTGGAAELQAKRPDEILAGKSNHWKYEAEYRLITAKVSMDIPGRVRRVLIGTRADEAVVKLLDKVMSPDIAMVRMKLVHGKVEVATGDLIPRTPRAG
ncbi:DUF2971 domain-containing protein [Tahibacter sp.]|uniref:DUF2971 domain-containing protein n=1 Tax=Tahibacter sp. TaxID=2056211 RepID=UPI0028C44F03|nr:DUF2971 domain-containing protein [Tahibacter sp.]